MTRLRLQKNHTIYISINLLIIPLHEHFLFILNISLLLLSIYVVSPCFSVSIPDFSSEVFQATKPVVILINKIKRNLKENM